MDTIRLIDPNTGKVAEVETFEAAKRIRTALPEFQYDPTQPSRSFRDASGQLVTLAPEDFDRGAGYAISLERANAIAAEDTRKALSFDSPAAAFAAGAARGATFGLSDQIASSLSPSWADDASVLRRTNPGASMGGEVAGSFVPLVLTGGGAAAGRAAAAGAGLLGASRGGTIARVVGMAAQGAVEGAALGLGKEIGDAALERRSLEASKVGEALGTGALLGGSIGAALPLAGVALRTGAEGATNVAGWAARKLGDRALSSLKTSLPESFAASLENRITARTLASTGGSEASIAAIRAAPEVESAASRMLSDEVTALQGLPRGAPLRRTEMLSGVELIEDAAKTRLTASLEALDAAAGGVSPRLERALAKAEVQLFSGTESRVFEEAAEKALRGRLAALSSLKDYRLSFSGLREVADEVGALGRSLLKSDKQQATGLLKLESLLAEELSLSAKEVANRTGIELGEVVSQEATRLAAARGLKSAIQEGIAAQPSLASTIIDTGKDALKGAVSFGGAAGLLSSPAAIPAAAAAGAAKVVGNSVAKRMNSLYGDQAVAAALRSMQEGSTAPLAAMVDGVIGDATRRYLRSMTTTGAEVAGKVASKVSVPTYMDRDAEIRRRVLQEEAARKDKPVSPAKRPLVNLPSKDRLQAASSKLEAGGASAAQVKRVREEIISRTVVRRDMLMDLAAGAPPDVRAVLQGQLAALEKNATYLLSKIPVTSNVRMSLTPQAEVPRMSKAQLDELVTAMRVSEDPLTVLESLERGTLSKIEVEALQQTAPQVYGQMVRSVQEELRARKEPLPYRDALQLSALLGIVGDPSLEPSNLAWLQAGFGASAVPQPQQAPAGQIAPRRGTITRSSDWSVRKEEK
jgi:hypothetical protein